MAIRKIIFAFGANDIVNSLPVIDPKIASSKYFDILEKLRAYLQSSRTDLRDFKELSSEAWKYSEEINEQNRKAEKESEGEAIMLFVAALRSIRWRQASIRKALVIIGEASQAKNSIV